MRVCIMNDYSDGLWNLSQGGEKSGMRRQKKEGKGVGIDELKVYERVLDVRGVVGTNRRMYVVVRVCEV